MKQHINLTTSEAIVLQQVGEDVEDDAWQLAKRVGMTRRHVMSVISHLQHKGLVALDSSVGGLWVRLTRKGHQLMNYVWPEAALMY
jgi:CTP-dependent riboflavin kinase